MSKAQMNLFSSPAPRVSQELRGCEYCGRENVMAALASDWTGDRLATTKGRRICLECLAKWDPQNDHD